ncbi:MAG: NAD(+)/NADH kinase [Actinobacteria bacterium]|nr:NAD(+)/NADH kinase [Actinomycetota bacterium]
MDYLGDKKIDIITIVPNLEKPDVPTITTDLIKWISERGIEPLLLEEDAARLSMPELAADEAKIKNSGAVVCLGGDGTILRAVRILKGNAVPVIGINMGRVGFLSEVELAEMYPSLERVVSGDFFIDERMMLKCTIMVGETQQEYLALNEIAIERGHHQRMLEMDVYINDIMFSRYTADGLIFATPTGSTAYSFSAGGPVVSPASELILLTPVNPHSLFDRTIALSAQDIARVEMAKRLEVLVGVDGFLVFATMLDSVEIKGADSKVLLIRLKERSFYTLFKNKLHVWDTWLR